MIDDSKNNETYRFRLYVAGATPKSVTTMAAVKKICEEHLPGRYTIDIVDLMENPQQGRDDGILVIPTLVCRSHGQVKKIVGDISDTQRTLGVLNLHSKA